MVDITIGADDADIPSGKWAGDIWRYGPTKS